MSNELVRTNLENSLAAKSLTDLVQAATDYPMLLLDVSGSMQATMQNSKTRIAALTEVVDTIILENGKPVMIAFGGMETSEPRFVDHVPPSGGGTPLHLAIQLAKNYGATRLVVISDGAPDTRDGSLQAAREFGGPIDVYYVGDPGDAGSFFLDELAKMTGGQRFEGSLTEVKQLAAGVAGLLMGAVEEERAPIQGEGFSAVESEGQEEDDEDDDDDEEEDDEDDDDDEDEDEA